LPPPAIDWQKIRNPVYARAGWSVKDAAMIIRGENIYVFFSAFFPDEGRERCHVSAVRTRDFLSFTEPLFIWSGVDRGFWGFCSPNIGQVGDTFVLTDNSWGDKDGQPNNSSTPHRETSNAGMRIIRSPRPSHAADAPSMPRSPGTTE
jgi:hypothetical protein